MEQVFASGSLLVTGLAGLAALVLLGFGVYWLFNKQARQRQLAELRARLDEMSPTDPQYNQARALYTSLMIEAHRGEFSDIGGSDGDAGFSDGGGDGDGDGDGGDGGD